jgi:hypothetical protein
VADLGGVSAPSTVVAEVRVFIDWVVELLQGEADVRGELMMRA